MDKVRLDKWLWAARFFKTRSLSAEAISGGKVHLNDHRVKPARAVSVGDSLTIHRGYDEYVVTILGLAEKRGSAKVAQTLYEETDESIYRREQAADMRKYQHQGLQAGERRPSGRDRQKIRRLSGKY
jgi:ribosome-associated heat shock protein Hsp15